MKIFGHRGAAGLVLENTIASVQKAIALKVDGVEFDVRATKDAQPIVVHDDTLERTHQVAGHIGDLSLSEIQRLTRTHEFPVATLSEVLETIGMSVAVNVEFKEVEAVEPSLRVLNELVKANVITADRILVTSFEHSAISMFREQTLQYQVGLLTRHVPDESFWNLAKSLDAYSVNTSVEAVNAAFVRQAHDDGREVMVYTVNEQDAADRLEAMGVDAIFTDVPDVIRRD